LWFVTSWWIGGPRDAKPPSQTNDSSVNYQLCNSRKCQGIWGKRDVAGCFSPGCALLILVHLLLATKVHISASLLRTSTDNITWKWCRSNVCLDLPVIISIMKIVSFICVHILMYVYHEPYPESFYFISFFHSLKTLSRCLSWKFWSENQKVAAPWPLGRLIQVSKVAPLNIQVRTAQSWRAFSFSVKTIKTERKKNTKCGTLPQLAASKGYRSENGRQSLRPELIL